MIVKVRSYGVVRGLVTGITFSIRRVGRNRIEDSGFCSVDVYGCRFGVSCFFNASFSVRLFVLVWAFGVGLSASLLFEKAARRSSLSDCDFVVGGVRAAVFVRFALGGIELVCA